jgi:hypothetical protein
MVLNGDTEFASGGFVDITSNQAASKCCCVVGVSGQVWQLQRCCRDPHWASGARTSSLGAYFKYVAAPPQETTFVVRSVGEGVVEAEGLGVGAVALGEDACGVAE